MPSAIEPAPPVIPHGGEEDRLRRLAATIPGMLYDYVLNPDGSSKFLYVGPKCREILELGEQDLLCDAGLFWELVVAEDLQRLKSEDVAANREGESFSAEVRIRTRSGRLKWIQLSSRPNPAPPGELVVWSGFMLEITERKQAEAEIRKLNASLEDRVRQRTADLRATLRQLEETQFAMDSVGIGVQWIDVETGRFVYVNKYVASELGYTPDEMLSLSVPDIDQNFPAEQFKKTVEMLREQGQAQFETVHRAKDGKGIPVEVTIFFRSGREIVPDKMIAFIKDITQRKDAELKLMQARDDAEAGNRAKTIFLANMSHELRTPMNGVMGMIDLALRRATDPKQIDWLDKSKRSAQRMVNVVNDIIDFSKIEAERLPLEEKNFSLSQMIDDAIAIQDIIAEPKGLNLIREIPATFPDQLSGDAFRIRQILLNFLGNACKFSDQGTITVRVSAAKQDGESVLARIEVEDQGIGISPEKQAMLFQAFAQVDGSMTRQYGGTGLGLIISKRLANMMGGEVGMVSQEGRGSTFWATVRLRPAKASEVEI